MERERRSTDDVEQGQAEGPSAQEACAEDPGCAHGKLNSGLLLQHKIQGSWQLSKGDGRETASASEARPANPYRAR